MNAVAHPNPRSLTCDGQKSIFAYPPAAAPVRAVGGGLPAAVTGGWDGERKKKIGQSRRGWEWGGAAAFCSSVLGTLYCGACAVQVHRACR